MKYLFLALALGGPFALWADEPSAFDRALQVDTAVETHESNVEFFNIRYRKIATRTASFYAKSAPGGDNTIDVYCGQPKFFAEGHIKEGHPVIFQRSRQFLQALNESCLAEGHKKTMELVLEPGHPTKTTKARPGEKKKPL